MSDNQGATSTPNLEEALAEIESLRGQLSGSDLKVFTQNRELRQENTRFREEVTRLTEECVTQTFAVRSLEKTKTKLEKQVEGLQAEVAGLRSDVSGLESNVAGLESQVADLKAKTSELESHGSELTEQLGVHRSQEIHLSQELERTISTNAEELSKLKAEQAEELETTRQTLEQARAEIERELSEKLAAKAKEVQGLEQRVEQFKEEFLSQEFLPPAAPAGTDSDEGRAFRLLRSKMEGLLGFPGKTLVEQVFRHCGADEKTSDPAVLEEAFEALQDTASKLVRNPEQEQELSSLLSSAWQDLGLGDRGGPASPSTEEAGDGTEAEAPAAEDASAPSPPVAVESQAQGASASEPEPVAEAESPTEEDMTPVEPPAAPEAEPVYDSIDEAVAQSAAEEPSQEVAPSEEAPSVEAESQEESIAATEEVAEAVPTEQTAPVEEATAHESAVEAVPAAGSDTSVVDEEPAEESAESAPAAEEATKSEALKAENSPTEPPAVEESTEDTAVAQQATLADEQSAQVAELAAEPLPEGPLAAEEPTSEPEAIVDSNAEPEQAAVSEEPSEAEEPAAGPSQEEAASIEEAQGAIVEAPAAEEEPAEGAADEESEDQEAASEGEDADFDAAAAALQNGDFAKAWPTFHELRKGSPTEPTYLVGEIASLAGLERFQEAYVLGKGIDIDALEDSADVYRESFESVFVGLAEQSESMLVRKLYLIELIAFVDDPERIMTYLDEAEEIALRTPREGELSLLQAKHRIGQDDVTEYLIDALNAVADKPEIFELLRQNLERYPELAPLSQFVERLLGSGRDEALEAERGAKELITSGESVEELLEETDPGEEALVQVFLEHLLPRTGVKVDLPSEAFEELLQESEPAAFVGALRQALRSVDYTMFFDEIEVLSYDGDDHFLLRSSPEPKPTLLFGSDVDDVPPEELRFLVLRELFSMYRRHSHLAHLAAALDDQLRYTFVKTCLEIHKEAEFQIPETALSQLTELEGLATEGGQDPEFRAKLEAGLGAIYQATESDSFLELADFLFDGQLHKKWLDPLADGFAAKQTGLVVASFAIARDTLGSDDFEALEEAGFGWLYQDDNKDKFRDLRLRLQRLWTMPFKALVSDAEE